VTGRRVAARVTANFERNLDDIRAFLSVADAKQEFDRLIAHLVDEIVPALEQFPNLGTDFLAKAPLSVKGRALFERVAKRAGAEISIRQLSEGEYILLYAVQAEAVVLLSIRHHRQLSFDFKAHWPW
jgi:plasmid stabilization system protein ParE